MNEPDRFLTAADYNAAEHETWAAVDGAPEAPTPGTHAAPIAEGHLPTHVISVCRHCGGNIQRKGLLADWYHTQTADVICGVSQ